VAPFWTQQLELMASIFSHAVGYRSQKFQNILTTGEIFYLH